MPKSWEWPVGRPQPLVRPLVGARYAPLRICFLDFELFAFGKLQCAETQKVSSVVGNTVQDADTKNVLEDAA